METYQYGVNFTQNIKTELHVNLLDNGEAIFGTGGDLKIWHTGSESIIRQMNAGTGDLYIDAQGSKSILIRSGDGSSGAEAAIVCNANAATELYHSGTKKFETTSSGATVTGALTLTSHLVMGANDEIKLGGSSQMTIYHSGSDFTMYNNTGNIIIANASGTGVGEGAILFKSGNNNTRWYIGSGGHFYPSTNNTFDIGTSSYRVRNIYTNDLNLSNEGGANDVDGTWGDYTIQEGESDLFLINKRSGKKFKFMLQEVS